MFVFVTDLVHCSEYIDIVIDVAVCMNHIVFRSRQNWRPSPPGVHCWELGQFLSCIHCFGRKFSHCSFPGTTYSTNFAYHFYLKNVILCILQHVYPGLPALQNIYHVLSPSTMESVGRTRDHNVSWRQCTLFSFLIIIIIIIMFWLKCTSSCDATHRMGDYFSTTIWYNYLEVEDTLPLYSGFSS